MCAWFWLLLALCAAMPLQAQTLDAELKTSRGETGYQSETDSTTDPTRLRLAPTPGTAPPPPTSSPRGTSHTPPKGAATQLKPARDVAGKPAPIPEPTVLPVSPEAAPLQRGGRLMDQGGLPSAPSVAGSARKALPPLNQVLLTATGMAEAESQRKKMASYGARIVSRQRLSGLNIVLSVFRLPGNADPQAFAEQLRGAIPDTPVEINRRYRLMGRTDTDDAKHYGQRMVGLTIPSHCTAALHLAMLDGGINPDISALRGRDIRFTDVTGAGALPLKHGSSIAALLLSSDTAFPGLLPGASLDAVNIFALDDNGDPETRTDWVLHGLNHIAQVKPTPVAVNLSFGGNHSAMIEMAIGQLSGRMLFVAAAGNGGTNDKVYPAAYKQVIAVGAVNAAHRRSQHSNFGEHVQLYAPGEDIWVSDERGRGYFASGSSFATPFATAALALARERGMAVGDYLATLNGGQIIDYGRLCRDP